MATLDRVAGGAVAVAVPVLVCLGAAAAAATPGYDGWSDTVSHLASPGQPWAAVVQVTVVAYGLLLVLAARAIASWSAGVPLQRLALRLAGVAMVVTGLARKDLPNTPHTMQSLVHVLAALGAGACLTLAMAASIVRRRRPPLAQISAAAVAMTILAAGVFPFAWGGAYYGAIERLILAGPGLWLTYVGGAVALESPAKVSRPSARCVDGVAAEESPP